MIKESVHQLNDAANRLIATGAVTIAAVSFVGEGMADAKDLNSNHIPNAAARAIRHNAARLTELGCSAWLLRGVQGEVDGVVTAVHCNLTDTEAPRLVDNSGQQYIVQPKPVKAKVGNRVGHMKTVAEIDEYVLPGSLDYPDYNHDLALGVAKGHTAAEVIKDYKRDSLPANDIYPGEKLYEGAYPQAQPANGNHMKRQSFSLTVQNNGFKPVGYNKPGVHMIFASMPASKDGAECSYGASGSVAFGLVKGKPKIAGTLSYFDDLTGSLGEYANNPKNTRGVAPTAAICGFSDQLDMPSQGGGKGWNKMGSIVKAVRSTAEIKDYMTPDQMIKSAHEQFNNPNISKIVLNGDVAIPNRKGGPDTPAFNRLLHRPVLFHFKTPATTILAEADPNESDHLQLNIFSDRDLGTVVVYPNDPSANPNNAIYKPNGLIQYQAVTADKPAGSFVDSNQQEFGELTNLDPDSAQQSYQLMFENDSFSLQPYLK